VSSPEPLNPEVNQAILEDWYLERARFKFGERLTTCFVPFQRMNFEPPQLTVRSLAKRWGSLTARGKLILNRDLIRASSRCIDYVITHELCHIQHPDHSSDFYNLMSKIMPDWEHRKQMLERKLA
jgi:predicted metal-dependent hydrolase